MADPPDWQRIRDAATGRWLQPAPPPRRERGQRPLQVELPLETAPKQGAIPFDYAGTAFFQNSQITFTDIIAFRVPTQMQGVILGMAAGSYTPADCDELEIELFVNLAPRSDVFQLEDSIFAVLQRAAVSSDLMHPTEIFLPIFSGDLIQLAARVGGLSVVTPAGIGARPVRGRLVGRFWPKLSATMEP